jgi:hypothetical protein
MIETTNTKRVRGNVRSFDVVVYHLNQCDTEQVVRAVRHAAQRCGQTGHALVVDLSRSQIDFEVFGRALEAVMLANERPPAVSVVVDPARLEALRLAGTAISRQGVTLGKFSSVDLARSHALRERRVVLDELASCSAESCSVSTICSASSIAAKARA